MSLTHIDELPTSPNRLTNYTTFTTDSPIFIDALTPFVLQLNTNLDTVSTFKPNKWNFGKLVDTNIFPPLTPYSATPENNPKPSVLYVSSIDQEYAYFKEYSQSINDYLLWFENILTERGAVDSWGTSLDITQMSTPMTRVMGRSEFTVKSITLSNSLRDNTLSLQQVKGEADGYFNSTLSFGLITKSVDKTYNFGLITDTTITNDI